MALEMLIYLDGQRFGTLRSAEEVAKLGQMAEIKYQVNGHEESFAKRRLYGNPVNCLRALCEKASSARSASICGKAARHAS